MHPPLRFASPLVVDPFAGHADAAGPEVSNAAKFSTGAIRWPGRAGPRSIKLAGTTFACSPAGCICLRELSHCTAVAHGGRMGSMAGEAYQRGGGDSNDLGD